MKPEVTTLNILNNINQLKFLLKYLKPFWKSILLIIPANIVVGFLSGLLPLIMAPVLNIVVGKPTVPSSGSPEVLSLSGINLNNISGMLTGWLGLHGADKFKVALVIGGVYVALGAFTALLSYGNSVLTGWTEVRITRYMQYDFMKHILSHSIGFFTRERTGELISRSQQDVKAVMAGIFRVITTDIIAGPTMIIIYGVLFFRTNPKLTLIALMGAALHFMISRGVIKRLGFRVVKMYTRVADVYSKMQEVIQNIRIVKSFSVEQNELNSIGKAMQQVVRLETEINAVSLIQSPVRSTTNRLVEVGILLMSVYEVIAGRLDVVAFFLFVYIGKTVMEPISRLGTTIVEIQKVLITSKRIKEIFDEMPSVQDGTQQIKNFCCSLRCDLVSFSYSTKKVLKDINLEVRKGEIVALVGPSGAGKTTLVDLLLRLYDPQTGSVTIDGYDIKTFSQSSYRKLFGVVSQDPLLFNVSIQDNISFGRKELGMEDIIRAARIANAHDFIMKTRDGYNTLIGDRGVRLSGGQRQRIAIARAVVHSPQILVLDEATSSLDSESESMVQEAISRVIENSTAIIIAHRLSTVLHADKIVVMDHGRILDQGTHKDLLARCELYTHLCELQFNTNGF